MVYSLQTGSYSPHEHYPMFSGTIRPGPPHTVRSTVDTAVSHEVFPEVIDRRTFRELGIPGEAENLVIFANLAALIGRYLI